MPDDHNEDHGDHKQFNQRGDAHRRPLTPSEVNKSQSGAGGLRCEPASSGAEAPAAQESGGSQQSQASTGDQGSQPPPPKSEAE
jgi:hypothetical protein